jgi:hypothetical protein
MLIALDGKIDRKTNDQSKVLYKQGNTSPEPRRDLSSMISNGGSATKSLLQQST